MHLTHLKIENLRSLAQAELDFNVPGSPGMDFPNVNVLLGGNGAGKTSVLRALALASLGPLLSSSSGYVPESLIRRPPGKRVLNLSKLSPAVLTAEVVLQDAELPSYARALHGAQKLEMKTTVVSLGTAERLQWQVEPEKLRSVVERLQFDDAAPAFFLVGYGATRRVEASTRVDESARTKSRQRRYERVASLFEDHLGLMPLSYWLPDYAERNKGRYVQVVNLINRLLPENCRIRSTASVTPNGTEHLFEMNGVTLPFRALSDGYRSYIGWIGDMLFHLCMGAVSGTKLVDTRGLVLIDEIDLHLHPEWQRVVLPTLSRALPLVQFVVTTHSPLVVGSLQALNLYSLMEEEGATVIRRLPEKVQGRSSEQILLSPYFGLDSTRAEPATIQLRSLAKAAVEGDPTASMKYLRLLAGGTVAESASPAPAKAAPKAVRKPAAKAARKTSHK
jgi:predicted ATP-binding protein involved in virulence